MRTHECRCLSGVGRRSAGSSKHDEQAGRTCSIATSMCIRYREPRPAKLALVHRVEWRLCAPRMLKVACARPSARSRGTVLESTTCRFMGVSRRSDFGRLWASLLRLGGLPDTNVSSSVLGGARGGSVRARHGESRGTGDR